MMRAILAACCLVGLVLGGAFAPAVGVQTPFPDLGGGGGLEVGGQAPGSDLLGDGTGVGSFGGVSGGGYPDSATVGGDLELSDHEELVVESPRASRWRLGAYGTYTGEGWDRDETSVPVDEARLATATGERPRPRYEITVTPRREVDALATVWRPAGADAGDRRVSVDGEGAMVVDDPIPAGESYTTVTYGPPSREAAAAEWGYPASVERYTDLPADTPDRLTRKTDAITADAETPYQTARAIERWLEANKAYSLDASHDRDADVATEFVFEMDEGYCQYFATSMAAMLRTQDVPARYVTGYGPGERVGDGEYLVRGSDAHAWVEVYMEGVGWVPFDPTPPDGRQDAGRDEVTAEDLEERFENGGFEVPESTPENDDSRREPDESSQDDSTDASVNVTLTPDPVPGRTVTATVTRRGEPVAGAAVLFNGDPIGKTDAAGNVTGEVPYERSLEIEVRRDDGSPRLAAVSPTGGYASVPPPRLRAKQDTVTFDVPTEIDVEVRGDLRPEATVDVVATIDGEPVRDAEVAVDGDPVARTDGEGATTVRLPDADTAELVVERVEARGNRTLDLTGGATADDGSLTVSVSPSLPLALPTGSATVAVERDGEPVPNATVAMGGEAVGETGPDGALDVDLPFADSATVAASAGDATGETTVEDLYRNLALAGGTGLLVLLVAFAAAYRRGLTPRVLAELARRGVVRTVRAVVAALVGLAGAADAGLATLVGWGRRAVELLGQGAEGARELLESLRAGAVSAVERAAALLREVPRRLHPRAILDSLRDLRRTATASVAAARAETLGADSDPVDDEVPTVREAWAELRTHVTVASWHTSTPGEIARWAVARDGLPSDAVDTLRDAFREVEYGARSPDDLAPAAREALDEIRASRSDDGGEQS